MQQAQFSNTQLELLKVFSHQVSDEDLNDLRLLLAQFFAEKAIAAADKVWTDEAWDNAKTTQLLNTKLRTPYR